MKKQNLSMMSENSEMDFSCDNVIKIILGNLIDRYSLIKIINDIINVTKKKESQLKVKNKIPLNSEDIISIIYKNVGSVKLYQCLLELNPDKIESEIPIKKKPTKSITPHPKKEKFIHCSKKSKLISFNSKEFHQIDGINNTLNNNNNNDDAIVIELNNSDEEKTNDKNNNIISLNENETTVYEFKEGTKTEEKCLLKRKRKKKKLKRKNLSVSLQNIGIYSESKLVNVKKNLGSIYQNKLGFHYIMEKGNIYKFKIKTVNEEKETALFSCDDINCKAKGEFSIINKSFKMLKGHNISIKEHAYNKHMIVQDLNILNYMMTHNIEDMQLTKI